MRLSIASGSKKSVIAADGELEVLDLTKTVFILRLAQGSIDPNTAVKLTADSIKVF